MKHLKLSASAIALAIGLVGHQASALADDIRIAAGTGILFAPFHVMKQAGLIEKHAEAAGITVTPQYLNFPSGSAVTDALISGNVDVIGVGLSNALLLWSRTRGDIKAVAAVSGTESILVTKDPAVQTLADFKPDNRISVTSLRVSNQAIYLQMALDKEFGDPNRFDPMMVQLGFTDAVQAMVTPNGAIDTMFAGPPYYQQLLEMEGMHPVLSTLDVAGPTTNLLAVSRTAWHDDHAEDVAVFLGALEEAQQIINDDPERAAELYLSSTGERFEKDEFAAMLADDGNVFQSLPMGTFQTAEFMARIGLIRDAPQDWKDYFFDNLKGRPEAANAD
ncbi:ABC transporter substrate-binding protein [Aureimonas sp. OT7]|uniref:ABC transporter substrate-binding protein n=1 Tax=Aureimonas sp. OT7 TaxID=2816454 RepID=UPI001783B866|nr:ABC transporter substrate-binding protein [Aureimonas sp. OT7]QOG08158.1 ABC transporter substrate-binding protein [Aureimonas sp. OT7]